MSSFITSELGGFKLSVFSTELTATSLAKFTISPAGLEHRVYFSGCEKFESQKIKKKLNSSFRISYLLPTSHGKLIEALSAKANFSVKIAYEVFREGFS